MTIAAIPLAAAPLPATDIEIEADVDLGVTSRLLDLLVTHDRFPRRMDMARDGRTMMVTMSLPPADGSSGRLLAKMRQIPGVRRADALADVP
ncbi:MAG: hypothetical protein ABW128_05300 [Rhizorhabdus sp.]